MLLMMIMIAVEDIRIVIRTYHPPMEDLSEVLVKMTEDLLISGMTGQSQDGRKILQSKGLINTYFHQVLKNFILVQNPNMLRRKRVASISQRIRIP